MLIISSEHVIGSMSPGNAPVATCKCGDTVQFNARDCYNQLVVDGKLTVCEGEKVANPATGPLFVEGAQPGDVLKVEILAIKVAPVAMMRTSPTDGAFQHNITERIVKHYDITGHAVQLTDSVRLPLKPMIGVIGTSPESDSVPTVTPREHGGNMDCKKITEGSTLYLPVLVPGALLAMGDLHAVMGDGEVMICGMECAGEITVRVSVLKGVKLPTPCLRTEGRLMTIQSADTLDEAAVLAAREMQSFIVGQGELDNYDAARLLSLIGDLVICQIVDPLKTVRMEIDETVLAQCGVKLPQ